EKQRGPASPPALGRLQSEKRLDAVLEALRLGQGLELLQRVVLDLPDPLAGDAERAPDLLERARRLAVQAEAELDDLPLAFGERAERLLDVLAPELERGRLERDRVLGHAQDLAHLLGLQLELDGDLVRARLAAEPLDELALDVHDLVQLLDHVHRNADRARLVRDRARDGLPDPPGRVGRELVALAVVELLDGPDQ